MEPVAPGTEDDELALPVPTASKKDIEYDRLLKIKANLPSGKYGEVFELSIVAGGEKWYCNLCQCPVMGRIYPHEVGRRHCSNFALYNSKKPIAYQSESYSAHSEERNVLHIAPGEPVPPGVEPDVTVEKVAQIQERLDSFNVGPLLGLEYLVELVEDDRDKEAAYQCMLCDKRGDPRTVIAHLASYNHMHQYIQRHFPTCFRLLSPFLTKQFKRNTQNTMNKLAEAIENKYGRLKPMVVEKENFEEKRPLYWNIILNGKHFSEKMGVTFAHLIIPEEITKLSTDDQNKIVKPSSSEDFGKRTYRKTGTVPGSDFSPKIKKDPSPPVVPIPVQGKKESKSAAPVNPRQDRRSLSSVSDISTDNFSDTENQSKGKPFGANGDRRSKSPARGYSGRRPFSARDKRPINNKRPRSRSPRNDRHRDGVLPWQREDYKKSREVSKETDKPKSRTDKFEEFKRLAAAIENDMEKQLKQHERNPEKHPQYNDEWKIFWNKRYKELQAEGKDAANYDFKPEWIDFWNKRMVELHNLEIKQKKDALRKRLSLPEEPAPICFRITGKKPPEDKFRSAPSTFQSEQEVIVIEDADDDTKSSRRSHSPWETESLPRSTSRISREKSRDRYGSRDRERDRRSRNSRDRSWERDRDYYGRTRDKFRDRSPVRRSYSRERSWDRESHRYRSSYRKDMDIPSCYKPPAVLRDVTRLPVYDVQPPSTTQNDDDDGEVNIVSVLRLLTALEEKLGSLGPKVIELLANALAMEKNEANSSETLLDNEINCVLFETVKEKLKGLLLAGLVSSSQERAFKNAIKKIASLIHFAGERKQQREKMKPKVDPVKVPGVGPVDKAAIAREIATALVRQGKTDVSQAELEQLINAVVGMAEASRNSEKPVTTASFLETLTQSKPIQNNSSSVGPLKVLQAAADDDISNMEVLSDADLQTLLQNFKDLSTDEQHRLILYLKKLESKEPDRVERLRKFVNLGGNPPKIENKEVEANRASPFSSRMMENVSPPENIDTFKKSPKKIDEPQPISRINLDSDDDDYTFEDVFKAAKQNVTEKEEKEKDEKKKIDLTDAKAIIANLMGNISKKNQISAVTSANTNPAISQATVDSFQNVSLNISSLASIVNNAKQLGQEKIDHSLSSTKDNISMDGSSRIPLGPNPNADSENSRGPINLGPGENMNTRGPDFGGQGLPGFAPRFNPQQEPNVRPNSRRYDEMDLHGPNDDERYTGSNFRNLDGRPGMGGSRPPFMDQPPVQYPIKGSNNYFGGYPNNISYPNHNQYMNRPNFNDFNRNNPPYNNNNRGGNWYR